MSWNMSGVAEALPGGDPNTVVHNLSVGETNTGAQAGGNGWVPKTAFDYERYNAPKEIGGHRGDVTDQNNGDANVVTGVEADNLDDIGWAGDAEVYEWSEEFGDIGPEHPALEKKLFRGDHAHRGLDFDVIAQINVIQEGTVRIEPIRTFNEAGAGLHPIMRRNVELAGYERPTPIQAYCLPAILKGHDIVACAQTGSGKTAAYLIPTLSKLMGKAKKLAAPRPNPATYDPAVDGFIRAEPLLLVIVPTRELATQIFDEARRFCYRSMLRPCAIYGGGPISSQVAQLQKGCDVLIATPGRLVDFIDKPHVLTLHRLKYTIIDEADELLADDWAEEFNKIMSGGDQNEGNINYMMFSATFPKPMRALARRHLAEDHVRIRVGRAGSSHMNIQQDVVWVDANQKRKALYDLLLHKPPARTIIFVNSKRSADELDDYLFNADLPSTSVHGDRTQKEREDAIRAFRKGKSPILVTTGVGARGLDVDNVLHVINYDMPSMAFGGIEEYTHRIGRTGRIGNKGLATSFYNDRDEEIGEVLTKTLLETNQEVPEFLQQYVPEDTAAPLEFESEGEEDDDADDAEEPAEAGFAVPVEVGIPVGPPATAGWGAQATPNVAPGGWGAPAPAGPPAAWNAQPPPTGPPAGSPAVTLGAWNAQPPPTGPPAGPPATAPAWGTPAPPSAGPGAWNSQPPPSGPPAGYSAAAPPWGAQPAAIHPPAGPPTAAPAWNPQPPPSGPPSGPPASAHAWNAQPAAVAPAPVARQPPPPNPAAILGGWNAQPVPAGPSTANGGWGAPAGSTVAPVAAPAAPPAATTWTTHSAPPPPASQWNKAPAAEEGW